MFAFFESGLSRFQKAVHRLFVLGNMSSDVVRSSEVTSAVSSHAVTDANGEENSRIASDRKWQVFTNCWCISCYN